MCRCAVRGCKRFVKKLEHAEVAPGLCYRHGWWYNLSSQVDYEHRCTPMFPAFTAGDVAVWLEWCGM